MSEFENRLLMQAEAMDEAARRKADQEAKDRAIAARERDDRIARQQRIRELGQGALGMLHRHSIPALPIDTGAAILALGGWHIYTSEITGFDDNGDAAEYKRHTGIDAMGQVITFREFSTVINLRTGDPVPAIFRPELFHPTDYSRVIDEMTGTDFLTGMASLLDGKGPSDFTKK